MAAGDSTTGEGGADEDGNVASMYQWREFDSTDKRCEFNERAAMWLDTQPEPRFDYITDLMRELFKTPIANISLIADDRVWAKSGAGPAVCLVPRGTSFCNYICVPPKPEVLICENTRLDARFSHNPYVKGDPAMIFYAGAPLVGTGGTRYGTLCVLDFKPRTFTAEMYQMLANFAELAVQEFENDPALVAKWTKQAMMDARLNNEMQACVSIATEGVAFLDTRRASWETKYANNKFAKACDSSLSDLIGKGFWHMFQPVDDIKFDDITDIAALGGSRMLTVEHKVSGTQFTVAIYPASSDHLAPGKATGVPSWVPSERDPSGSMIGVLAGEEACVEVSKRDRALSADLEKCFYFAVIQPHSIVGHKRARSATTAESGQSSSDRTRSSGQTQLSKAPDSRRRSSSSSGSAFSATYADFLPPENLAGLQLGPLLGSGSFGKVYRGYWQEELVAAKIVRCMSKETFTKALEEGKLGLSMNHPNVVKTLQLGVEVESAYIVPGSASETSKVDAEHILWIIQEFCDRGTLADGVERGWLRQTRNFFDKPDMLKVYKTMKDIAEGMIYIHEQGYVHCDLNGRNVMLQNDPDDSRGFVAKVCDFGMAQVCSGEKLAPNMFGTVSHMPPEMFVEQMISPAGDVWAFGVTLWELVSGCRAHCGKSRPAVIMQVTRGNGALQPPDFVPQTCKDMIAACMQYDPKDRPTFAELSGTLDSAIAACSAAEG